MAQPMMHLLIADKIYTKKYVHSFGDFLLGSIAPDAVHVKENYTREIKDISHYRFDSKSHISHFDTFINEFYTPENRDFVVGYLVHLLSDMVWYHHVRVPFVKEYLKASAQNMSSGNLAGSSGASGLDTLFAERDCPKSAMNEAYYADCEQIERLMFWEKDAPRIIEAIKGSKAYSLEGLIDADDVKAWKEKLIFDYNNKTDALLHTIYISEQQIRSYITDCAKECMAYLRDLPYFRD